jgi:hypothetical protein
MKSITWPLVVTHQPTWSKKYCSAYRKFKKHFDADPCGAQPPTTPLGHPSAPPPAAPAAAGLRRLKVAGDRAGQYAVTNEFPKLPDADSASEEHRLGPIINTEPSQLYHAPPDALKRRESPPPPYPLDDVSHERE